MNDNPSLDVQVGKLIERVSNQQYQLNEMRSDVKELLDAVARLGLLQREQNGNVSRIVERANAHDLWHGDNDVKIGTRIGVLEQADHDAAVVKGVWLSQWKALTASATMGAALATIISITVHLIGGF